MKKFHFIIILGVMALFSCEKTEPSRLFLIQEKYHSEENPDLDWVGKYSYSDDGLLIRFEESKNNVVGYYINSYYSNNVMDSSEYYVQDYGEFKHSTTSYYTFDANNNLKSIIQKGTGFRETITYNYKNEKIDSIIDEAIIPFDTLYFHCKYMTNNLGNIVSRQDDRDYQQYEYDDKVNPIQKLVPWLNMRYYDVEYFSPDNCTKDAYYSYRYEYNSRGLPVKKYATDIQTSLPNSVVEYQYGEK